jgi:hypothetical protein
LPQRPYPDGTGWDTAAALFRRAVFAVGPSDAQMPAMPTPTVRPAALLLAGLLWLAPALAVAAADAADKVYKYRLDDGSILYSDEASGPGTLEEIITAPPPAPAQTQAAIDAARQRAQAADARQAARRSMTLDDAERDLHAAQSALAQAQAALQSGLTPLPGERLGNVDGHTRLAPAYWQRVALLRAEVDRARARVDQANAEVRQLR